MKKLALAFSAFCIIGNACADIYSEHSNQGDIFMKTTKNKAGYIRFQKCEIPTDEETEYDPKKCSDVLSGTSKIFYSPQILSNISQSLKRNATTGAAVSIVFMLGAGLLQNAETLMTSKTISTRILSGKKVTLANLSNKSLEEIRTIEKSGEIINLTMTSYLKGLEKILTKYNKEYK